MDTLQEAFRLLLGVVPIGGTVRIILCLIYAAMDMDNASSYKRKAKNTLIYVVVCETVLGFLGVITSYFGGAPIF